MEAALGTGKSLKAKDCSQSQLFYKLAKKTQEK